MKNLNILHIAVTGLLLLISFLFLIELSDSDSIVSQSDQRVALLQTLSLLLVTLSFFAFFSSFYRSKPKLKLSSNLGDSSDDQIFENDNGDVAKNNVKAETKLDVNVGQSLMRADSLEKVANVFLSLICSELKVSQGIVSVRRRDTSEFYIKGTYAYYNENTNYSFKIGEGICGQVAKNKKSITLTNIPEGYISIVSGLGESSPRYLQVIPVLENDETIAIVELASFSSIAEEINDLENGVIKQLSKRLSEFM